ncbi:ABC transporter permease [Knoellia sinensis KCTC 19936]|uniref:ABC transporter permease n=1 Tax=Knoellia sinensis KCTC 19936 TaxID=1385520 RepID=A0A0A0J2D7_9MICO|nr:carbohydrate ABC transporter permease [Knoellia sinensis]KGN30859.1 ABC transporter permease [Knoellia sinensis KCTC 19936]
MAVLTFFPFYAMVLISFKPAGAVDFPGILAPWNLELSAYQRVLGGSDLIRWFINSVIYSLVSVVLVLLLATLAGYAFAKKRFPGRSGLFWSFLAMVMVPYHVTLIPTFAMLSQLHGVSTWWGLILPTIANAQAVFLMRQFILGIPDDLFEAARIDGASELRTFFTLVVPLCRPILATLGVFVFLWHWNDFLWPLIMARKTDMWTLTVGVSSLQEQAAPFNVVFAGATLSLAPVFIAYLFAQRHFVEGVASTGIKG